MIFVTVGTHEQQFNRLIEKIDKLVGEKVINEDVIIQSGFSTYKVENCICKNIIPYSEMIDNIKNSRIVITHGGPATFIMPLQIGKIPVVIPRLKKFDEHVNDHQLHFAQLVKERQGNIILVEDIDDLANVIINYENIIEIMPKEITSNNKKFNEKFKDIVKELFIS
ncbi:MAG: multidrug MFS transporter [Clostridium baratii]|uniref:glycosyltransferase n=1 Tax=Clostridium baratii TaxID=1561 RepID=UPI00242BA171|nr:glycosyltransferase [Clostridium baratii]MBS6007234.1 multidrug MFS transporter [Clostridium baratii]